MINVEIKAFQTAFRLAVYSGPLSVAQLTSEDDQSALPPEVHSLEQLVGRIPGGKGVLLDGSRFSRVTEDFA